MGKMLEDYTKYEVPAEDKQMLSQATESDRGVINPKAIANVLRKVPAGCYIEFILPLGADVASLTAQTQCLRNEGLNIGEEGDEFSYEIEPQSLRIGRRIL